MASPAQASLFEADPPAPTRGPCESCGELVLTVELDGERVPVDAREVLETFPCPQCEQVAGRGHERSGCSRCGGAGVLGTQAPMRGVRLDPVGRAALYVGRRVEGEAVHRFHTCPALGDLRPQV